MADSTVSTISSQGKPPTSLLSADIHIVGNIRTTGDIQVEGNVEGDLRANLATIGDSATVTGEVSADDIVVNGRVSGKVRGNKVRLTATARVEGDIIHKTIAIESGAYFEGTVQRQDAPLDGLREPASGDTAKRSGSSTTLSAPAGTAATAASTPAAGVEKAANIKG